ncbi:hypothetical protein C5B42_06075 [Candidatus Cerribacteria bacterium 'Amazon FNV 2010 28 9']|uniref:Uncharacterized protein n=1 Tax=Candidatus Cerribacteria bacterium 'Amazon FNV 2010 28 9' TaxID=2081795 RepID=A0A317JMS2_9BACT|nr:MAG: hypothetical protein C5B42_06075 [Candidatus Cerribacteria bacterium 'Amazon FNV 2010 28 9']
MPISLETQRRTGWSEQAVQSAEWLILETIEKIHIASARFGSEGIIQLEKELALQLSDLAKQQLENGKKEILV